MSKQFKPFWKITNSSIQEPSPHHTVLCKSCGYLYNRRARISHSCPKCNISYHKVTKSEFYVGKKKIYLGKDLEKQRRRLR